MTNPNNLYLDPETVNAIAAKIGNLLNDMSAFTTLSGQNPNPGGFATAKWLKSIVDDRRDGLVTHAQNMRLAMEDVSQGLQNIVRDFQNNDNENSGVLAQQMSQDLNSMESNIATNAPTLASSAGPNSYGGTSGGYGYGGGINSSSGYAGVGGGYAGTSGGYGYGGANGGVYDGPSAGYGTSAGYGYGGGSNTSAYTRGPVLHDLGPEVYPSRVPACGADSLRNVADPASSPRLVTPASPLESRVPASDGIPALRSEPGIPLEPAPVVPDVSRGAPVVPDVSRGAPVVPDVSRAAPVTPGTAPG